jgi:hypothetical protein
MGSIKEYVRDYTSAYDSICDLQTDIRSARDRIRRAEEAVKDALNEESGEILINIDDREYDLMLVEKEKKNTLKMKDHRMQLIQQHFRASEESMERLQDSIKGYQAQNAVTVRCLVRKKKPGASKTFLHCCFCLHQGRPRALGSPFCIKAPSTR